MTGVVLFTAEACSGEGGLGTTSGGGTTSGAALPFPGTSSSTTSSGG